MEMAKVLSKGQMTLPLTVRKRLGVVDEGNSNLNAFNKIQSAFAEDKDNTEIQTEEYVVKICKEIRRERWKTVYGRDD